MNCPLRWNAVRASFLCENFVYCLLNGCINLLPSLRIIIRRLMSTNRSIDGRHRQQRENRKREISCYHQIAASTTTTKCPYRDAQANKIDYRI